MEEIKVGDIVQITPEYDKVNKGWGGVLLVVTALKPSWDGIQGYAQRPKGGQAYLRLEIKYVIKVGQVKYFVGGEYNLEVNHVQRGNFRNP